MNAVSARGLVKRFGDVTALGGVDLDVNEGEIFGLLGPNGAGKTTTVRILVTLARADEGTATVAGADVMKDPTEVRRRIGYVPQEITADRYLTPREQLSFFADLYHLPAAARRQRTSELLALVGLESMADKVSRGFSGGMKKKLDLACGLIHEPKVLFLDEPSLGLDVTTRRTIWDYILDLKRRGVTIILCTNYMDEADKLCDRVAVVDGGKIAAVGTPDALRAGLGGDVVTVEAETKNAGGDSGQEGAIHARLESALTGLPFVRGTAHDGTRLHIYVNANETALPKVIETASAAGIPLRSVSYSRPGLEEVFLKYTGHAFAEAQAIAAAEAAAAAAAGRKAAKKSSR
jgi:ABC-2 type transport system ATP-binding protein